MQRASAAGAIEGTAQRLAIDGEDAAGGGLDQGIDPLVKALLKGGRVEEGEDAPQGVMGGDAMGQSQEGLQPVELAVAILFDLDPGIGPGDDRTDGQAQDVPEIVVAAMFPAWVVEVGETVAKGNSLGHHCSSVKRELRAIPRSMIRCTLV
ncbi:MAG: hypothetical protein JNM56_34265 [Planctomycetia bacterium]|nr:hypothetical protein [Planctomycetia bacterium]